MLIIIKNTRSNKLEQKFINDNFAQFNYVEYVKSASNKQFEDAVENEIDFILVKDIKIFNSEELTQFRDKLRQFDIKGIIIDNSKKYNQSHINLSDNFIQVNPHLVDPLAGDLSITIAKCSAYDLSCFPLFNPKQLVLE